MPGRHHTTGTTKTRKKRPRDPVQLGKLIVDIATGQTPDAEDDGKDAAPPSWGARAARHGRRSLTPEQRAEIARKGAAKRWGGG